MDEIDSFELGSFVPTESTRGVEGPSRAPPDSPAEPPRTRRFVVAGGVVAHNEERTIAQALESLLSQELPEDCDWGTIWVVASGCTDGTAREVSAFARSDPRVRLVLEAERGGKARALRQVFARATGDALVLLNADARAEPGAVRELLRCGRALRAPYAVMGQPVAPAPSPGDALGEMMQLLWRLHHEFHREVVGRGQGAHLSDELMLVSLPELPAIPEGVINDGSFLAAWVEGQGGACAYAEDARVSIEVPNSLQAHLNQRRRILVGHRQVTTLVGHPPATLPSFARRHPAAALRIFGRAARAGRARLGAVGILVGGELASVALAVWDRLPPRRDHVRWTPVATNPAASAPALPNPPSPGSASPGSPAAVDRRIGAILRIAEKFQTGVSLEDLAHLLPRDSALDPGRLSAWLETRPDLARLEAGRAFRPGAVAAASDARLARGVQFQEVAHRLVSRDLAAALPWVRCVGVTGSAAYGEPREGDDLDFFVVTRKDGLWLFLAYTYLALRLRYRPDPAGGRPEACFNLVVDERRARDEFAEPRGFLIARETLTARAVHGEEYYRRLIGSSTWMEAEIPRLFAARSSSAGLPAAEPLAWPLRLLNAALFPVLATYLQLLGLRGNARFEEPRKADLEFRTETRYDRLAFESGRFDRLRSEYSPDTSVSPFSPPGPTPVPR